MATAEAKQALRFLIQSNVGLEINEELVLLRDAFLQMRDVIVSLIRKKRRSDDRGVAPGTEQFATRDGAFAQVSRPQPHHASSGRPAHSSRARFFAKQKLLQDLFRKRTGGNPTEAAEKRA